MSELGPAFAAGYESDADCCGETIEIGDQIRADGRGGWIHDRPECMPGQPAARPSGMCGVCFQVPARSGACGCDR